MAKPKLSIASLAPAPETMPDVDVLTRQQVSEKPISAAITKKRIKATDKKLVGFRLSKGNARQLEKMAWDEELSIQGFLLKTINLYRQTRGLSPLAE